MNFTGKFETTMQELDFDNPPSYKSLTMIETISLNDLLVFNLLLTGNKAFDNINRIVGVHTNSSFFNEHYQIVFAPSFLKKGSTILVEGLDYGIMKVPNKAAKEKNQFMEYFLGNTIGYLKREKSPKTAPQTSDIYRDSKEAIFVMYMTNRKSHYQRVR